MIETTDADALVAFAAVVEAGSFSAAARELGTTRQSIHRRVVRLEDHAGLRLLERSTRQVRATAVGLRVYQHAVAVRDALHGAAEEVRSASAVPAGRLRVSVPPLMARTLFPPVVVAFTRAYPSVSLELLSDQRLADLLGESVDLAVRVGPLDSSSLLAVSLGHTPQILVASPTLPGLAGLETLADLQRVPGLLYGPPPRDGRWALSDGEVRLRPRLVSTSAEVLREAALEGLGVAALPALFVAPELEAGRLVQVVPAWSRARPVHAVYASRVAGNPALAAFLAVLQEELAPRLARP
jgi:DNA-binding transcriptional LysR family regulator